MEYVIGIDIGSTKSHLALFDTEGNLTDFARWGSLNHEGMEGSFAQFEEEFSSFVLQVVPKNGITMDDIACSVLGVSGVDTKKQHKIISGILTKLGFKNFTLINDAFLGIPAGSGDGTGICAINGTGCTLAGIGRNGKTLQIGGVGYVSADYGGGGIMGRAAVSAIYMELFRKGEPTVMTPKLFSILGITDKHEFVEKIYDKIEDGSFDEYSCPKLLFSAAAENDKVACRILSDVAINYGGGIICMTEELEFSKDDDIHIILAGSVFVKGEHPFLADSLKEYVMRNKPDYKFIFKKLEVPPVAGAASWALKNLKGRCDCNEKIHAQLKGIG